MLIYFYYSFNLKNIIIIFFNQNLKFYSNVKLIHPKILHQLLMDVLNINNYTILKRKTNFKNQTNILFHQKFFYFLFLFLIIKLYIKFLFIKKFNVFHKKIKFLFRKRDHVFQNFITLL